MLKKITFILLLCAVFCIASCSKAGAPSSGRHISGSPVSAAAENDGQTLEQKAALEEEKRRARLKRAADIVSMMTDEQLAAQLIMTGIDACGSLSDEERERLRRIPAGAIMLFKKNLNTDARTIREMINELRGPGTPLDGVKIEPFIAVDHEGGDVHRFGDAASRLPAPLSYWSMEDKQAALLAIEQDAEKSGKELAALGITMNLAPLAEIITEENSGFLGSRSYGPDAAFTAKAAAAFIRGMNAANIACVVKHFPGNAGVDPHIETPFLRGSEKELLAAVQPFAAAINEENPSAVMVSHVVVPAWDAFQNASLSEVVMLKKLRGDIGFDGVILADDFSMGAVSGGYKTEEKTISALRSGADMVMAWPRNLTSIHNAILGALADGSLSREQLQASAARIVSEKLRVNGRGLR